MFYKRIGLEILIRNDMIPVGLELVALVQRSFGEQTLYPLGHKRDIFAF